MLKLPRHTFGVICILSISLWGLWSCSKPVPSNPTPDAELKRFLLALKSNDITGAKKLTSRRAARILEGLPSDKDWKNFELYGRAEEWHLNHSQTIWPILQKWALVVEKENVDWLSHDSNQNYLYPRFQYDESLGLLFAVQSNGEWAIDEIVVALAK